MLGCLDLGFGFDLFFLESASDSDDSELDELEDELEAALELELELELDRDLERRERFLRAFD